MNIRKCSDPMKIKGIEEWMTQFFTDPFTNILDEHTFRVDLFETSEDFIVEAELGETQKKEEIDITIRKEQLTINVHPPTCHNNKNEDGKDGAIKRKITLPYPIDDKEISAIFSNGILEIIISKNCKSKHKRDKITIKG